MSEYNDELKKIIQEKQFKSLDEAQRFIDNYREKWNHAPVEALGGLTPHQMQNMLYIPFDSDISPVIINKELSEEELAGSILYQDAKIILGLFEKHSPVKATAAGNINRQFVSIVMGEVDYDTSFIRKYNKAINEYDFFWFNTIRMVLLMAGLIKKEKKHFKITAKGKQQLHIPGELYYLLFKTFFMKLNLACLDSCPEWMEIQVLINFPLYMVRTQCEEWIDKKEFLDKALVKGMRYDKKYKNDIEKYGIDRLMWAGESRIVEPLIEFGLLESRKTGKKDKYEEKRDIRITQLFKKYINFNFKKGMH